MLRAVGITDPARRAKAYPFEMSGGMCQRVMIAIALAAKPSLLIADEPTTGLDVTTQAVIMDLVNDLATRARHGDDLHHPRSGARRPALRAHRRHACRPRGRERADRGPVRQSAPSLYGRADRGDAGFGGEASTSLPPFPARCPICAAPTCRRAAIPSAARARLPPARSRCRIAVAGRGACRRLLESAARAICRRPNRECSMTALLDVADVSKRFPVGGRPGSLGAVEAPLLRRRREHCRKSMRSTMSASPSTRARPSVSSANPAAASRPWCAR